LTRRKKTTHRTFTVRLWREDGYWLAELVEEPRVHTFGRTLAKVREHIADATALWFESDGGDFEIVERFDLGELGAKMTRALEERARAREAETSASEALAEAVAEAEALGISRRDAAGMLGLSHQRVQQLSAS
jgi:predicted RNase H-like HicB family nuclease